MVCIAILTFRIGLELMQSPVSAARERAGEELQTIQKATEKLYKELGGRLSERMMSVPSLSHLQETRSDVSLCSNRHLQDLKEKCLEQLRDLFHHGAREMRSRADHLKVGFCNLQR
jgi:hypothetical protein